MAMTDNLPDFLTSVADAIREKKGTTELINAQNFPEEILKLGGGMTDEQMIAFTNQNGVYANLLGITIDHIIQSGNKLYITSTNAEITQEDSTLKIGGIL